jgi:hypothetical protein
MSKSALALATILALGLPAVATAATAIYSFTLDGTKEVPANLSPAAGSAQVTVDDTADTITFALTAFNLGSPVTGLHIHGPALPTANAPIVFNMLANATSQGPVTIGPNVIPNSFAAFGGAGSTFADAINAAPSQFYVNLHTQSFPGGEIRGQLSPIPEASSYAMFIGGLAVLGLFARRRRQS